MRALGYSHQGPHHSREHLPSAHTSTSGVADGAERAPSPSPPLPRLRALLQSQPREWRLDLAPLYEAPPVAGVPPGTGPLQTTPEEGEPRANGDAGVQPGAPRERFGVQTCPWPNCQVLLRSLSQSERHMRTHTGERPFACHFRGCNHRFSQAGGLKRHMRTHTGEKPHACPFEDCDAAFGEQGNLARHVRSHTGERPYACRLGCNKAFCNSSHRQRHERIHKGEKPFKCQFPGCSRAFTQSSGLHQHQRSHARPLSS